MRNLILFNLLLPFILFACSNENEDNIIRFDKEGDTFYLAWSETGEYLNLIDLHPDHDFELVDVVSMNGNIEIKKINNRGFALTETPVLLKIINN